MSGHAHPIMTGILIGMWATPTMTLDHLLFAAGATVYVWIGVFFEERSLLRYRGLERLAVRDEATCLGRRPCTSRFLCLSRQTAALRT